MDNHKLVIRRTFNASPEQLFRAWTEPAAMRMWKAPEGLETPAVEVDLRVGGTYAVTMRQMDSGALHVARGVYKEIDPPRRLVFTWAWDSEMPGIDGFTQETQVTVELLPTAGGNTDLVLTHELFANMEAKASHEQGWASTLNKLERFVAAPSPSR